MSYPKLQIADGIHSITFDSLSELLAYASDREAGNHPDAIDRGNHCAFRFDGVGSVWANGKTMDILKQELVHPNRTVVDAVEALRQTLEDQIEPPTQRRRKRRNRLEDGAELSEEAWIQRDPEGWSDTVRIHRAKRTVRIGVNVVVSAMREPHELLWRGAAIACLADLLTQQGHSVEVVAFWSVYELCPTQPITVVEYSVKKADMPMDVASVALALAEIGFVRIAVHAAGARVCTSKPAAGLGRCAPMPSHYLSGFDVFIDQDCFDKETAIQRVLDAVGLERKAG